MLQALKKDIGRNIIRGFFMLWRLPVFIMAIGMVSTIWESVQSGHWDWWDIAMKVIALPLVYLAFWKLPVFLTKAIDKDYWCIKNGDVVLAEKTLISVRVSRERTGSSGNRHYKNVYFATVGGDNMSFEIKTSQYVYQNCRPEDVLYIMSYGMKTKHTESIAIPCNFVNVLSEMGYYCI